jgi:hypothetical protein
MQFCRMIPAKRCNPVAAAESVDDIAGFTLAISEEIMYTLGMGVRYLVRNNFR